MKKRSELCRTAPSHCQGPKALPAGHHGKVDHFTVPPSFAPTHFCLHAFLIKKQCEDSNCCPRFQAWGVFTNASNDSIHFSSIVSFCTALTLLEFSFRPFFVVNSDWFRFPAAITSSSGPKYSLHRVTSDGHVVRVLLAHQECLLYGRVHWAGADLQIRGLGETSGLSLV